MTTNHNIDNRLERIARKSLDIETLETRNSDQLDFHTVSVWQLQTALREAYDEGTAQDAGTTETTPELSQADLEYLWNLCVADAGSCRDYGDERQQQANRAGDVASRLMDIHNSRKPKVDPLTWTKR